MFSQMARFLPREGGVPTGWLRPLGHAGGAAELLQTAGLRLTSRGQPEGQPRQQGGLSPGRDRRQQLLSLSPSQGPELGASLSPREFSGAEVPGSAMTPRAPAGVPPGSRSETNAPVSCPCGLSPSGPTARPTLCWAFP